MAEVNPMLEAQMDAKDVTLERYAALLAAGEDPVLDDCGHLNDYALEVIAEVGRPYTVLLTTGGPHIEIIADGYGPAELVGHWGTEPSRRHGQHLTRVLDYFTGRGQ